MTMQVSSTPKVCVIGAGPSGLAMSRVLAASGMPFDCLEAKSTVGGLWSRTDNGPACGYSSLHSNTSRKVMEFPSYPMPKDYPDYPHHSQIATYLEEFTDHFGIRDHVRFDTTVTKVERSSQQGNWLVSTQNGSEVYQTIIVASGGRHGKPNDFRIPGQFDGLDLHSYEYDDASEFRDKRVLVVGLGATSADLACEVARVAKTTHLAVRTGHYVVPKLFSGRPIDETSPLVERLSVEKRRPLVRLLLQLTHGKMSNYGLPDPPYGPGQAPLIASSELLVAIKQGQIHAKPQPTLVAGNTVTFQDGQKFEYDIILYCTGYDIHYPFLEELVPIVPDDSPHLYRHVAYPDVPGLFFVGLVHSTTALMPVAEAQAEWVGELLNGVTTLPTPDEMWRIIRHDRKRQESRFYDTSMHLIEDLHEYVKVLEKERMARIPFRRPSMFSKIMMHRT